MTPWCLAVRAIGHTGFPGVGYKIQLARDYLQRRCDVFAGASLYMRVRLYLLDVRE